MRGFARTWAVACAGLLLAPSATVLANPESAAIRARAAAQVYSLDHDQAADSFRQAIAADPQDAAAHRGLATTQWLKITFRRGNMTIDDYLGRVTKPNGTLTPPPADTAAAFRDAIERAIAIGRQRVAANPNDADAHYQLGAAVGLRASYTASVDGSASGAFRAAREAYDEHERVLSLDPKRKDASLIVGTYRYIVSTLALPMRMMAYVVGFGGGRERGIQMVEEAAAYGGDNKSDAQFALLLLYNREKRYDDALRLLTGMRESFPRNRLLWLETGSTYLRAGRSAEAERFLNDGVARFADDKRTKMYGEEALWRLKRGTARAWLGRRADAEADLKQSIAAEGRPWVHGRAHLELGRLLVKAGDKALARQQLEDAIRLCDSDNDPYPADEARRLLK